MALYGEIKRAVFSGRTSMFWGAGVTAFSIDYVGANSFRSKADNTTPTILNAMVAIGIVIGAGLAFKFVTLKRSVVALHAGVSGGLGVVYFSF